MGTYYLTRSGNSQLRDANEANPTADNGSLTDWLHADEFVLYTQVCVSASTCNKAADGASFKLQFDVDGAESWADVASGQAVAPGTGTTLVDDTEPGTERISTPPSSCGGAVAEIWENEGDNLCPNSGTTAATASEDWHEIAWALDPALAGGVVLTTVTDVIGYSAFLGLGAWYLL